MSQADLAYDSPSQSSAVLDTASLPDNQSTTSIPSRPHSASISSVHFAEPLLHRGSVASLRHNTNNDTLTPPRPVLKARSSSPVGSPDPARSRDASPHSAPGPHFKTLPTKYDPLPPHLTHRTSSQDRRVRSEGGPLTRVERSGSLLAIGKRASVLTGGYETSDDEVDHEDQPPQSLQLDKPRLSQPINGLGILASSDEGRRKRSKSLISPSLASGQHASFLRREPLRDSRNHARSSSFRTHMPLSRNSSQKAAFPNLPTSRSDSFFGGSPDVQSSPGAQSTSRHKNDDRTPKDDGSSTQGSKGKGKERDRHEDGLVASLGLGVSNKDVALTPDQINNLLTDSDVASALRLMTSSHLNSRLSPLPPSAHSTPPPSRPTSPPPSEPFIAHAPPPLTQNDSPHGRNRNVSVSSSIMPPSRSPFMSGHTGYDMESMAAARRRRASSRVEVEGGHIPFTHHIPTVYLEEEPFTDQEAQSATTIEAPGVGVPDTASLDNSTLKGTEASSKKDGHSGRHRFSQLFHIHRKKSTENLSESKGSSHLQKEREKEEKEKEKERLERDAARRRLEQERRDAEMAQERRFRALTQVAAHPVAERMAYRASSHLRALYEQVYQGIENPPKMNPLAILRWKHRTAEQVAAKTKWEQASKLSPSRSPHGWGGPMHSSPASIGSGRPRSSLDGSSSRSPGDRRKEDRAVAKWWIYTVEDIVAYNDADGVVNYFIPPRPILEQTHSHDSDRARSSQTHEEGSSIGGGSIDKRADVVKPRVTSISTASLTGHPASHESGFAASALTPVSRATSNETGKRSGRRDHRLTHRSHQSLGAMGPTSLSQALKVPFERFGSVTRKPRSSTAPRPIHIEDTVESLTYSNHNSPHLSRFSRAGGTSVERKDHFSRFKPNGGSLTDEDRPDREFHLRRLFLKGQRPYPYDPRRPEAERMASGGTRIHDREVELQALEKALARESAFRERQAEAARQTQLEEDARLRLEKLEDEIYAERSQQMLVAKKRLEEVDSSLQQVEDSVKHYITQIDQLSTVAKVSAEVEARYPEIETIRSSYTPKSAPNGEASDVLAPLRQSSTRDSASGSEARHNGSKTAPGPRHRKSTLPSLYSYGPKPWPRRTSLSPDGTSSVNPIRRLELTLQYSRDQHGSIQARRDDTLVELRSMITHIDSLIRQKDAVRSWTKAALESNRTLRVTVDTLKSEVRGNSAARFGRLKDRFYNTLFRLLLTPLLKVSLSGVRGGRYLWSRRNREARASFRGIRSTSEDIQWFAWFLVGIGIMVFWLYWEGGKEV